MWTISKLTFKEILSKRIFLITMIMTLVFLALYGTGIYFAGKEAPAVGANDIQGTEVLCYSSLFLHSF